MRIPRCRGSTGASRVAWRISSLYSKPGFLRSMTDTRAVGEKSRADGLRRVVGGRANIRIPDFCAACAPGPGSLRKTAKPTDIYGWKASILERNGAAAGLSAVGADLCC